jgi:OOP family OmpA-OmpF porin
MEFQGASSIAITGELPAPPPPPPPPPPPEEPKPPARVEVRDNKIEIREKIQFERAKADIKEVSFDLLKEIGQVIKDNPHIKRIRIEGHASSDGDDNFNMRLSDDRAKAVKKHLIEKEGIANDMLVAKGFGETKPIADNETEEGRIKNRRVEFNIIAQDITKKKIEIDPDTGKEKVIEETTKSKDKRNIKAAKQAEKARK